MRRARSTAAVLAALLVGAVLAPAAAAAPLDVASPGDAAGRAAGGAIDGAEVADGRLSAAEARAQQTLLVGTDLPAEAFRHLPGVIAAERSPYRDMVRLRSIDPDTTEALLEARDDLAYVHRDVVVSAAEFATASGDQFVPIVAPDDPLWRQHWGASRSAVERFLTSSAEVDDQPIIAVLDTGVNLHADLEGRVLEGASFTPEDDDPEDDDPENGRGDRNGHGTMAALVAAGSMDNQLGAAGLCPRCTVLPVRVLKDNGDGQMSWIADGIDFALDAGADVINISAAGANTDYIPLRQAVARATGLGVPIVASAGNGEPGRDVQRAPAVIPNVIGVSGHDSNGARYAWSNFGRWVDIAAPGTIPVPEPDGTPGSRTFRGTSASAPFVAGAIASRLALGDAPQDHKTLVEEIVAATSPASYVEHGVFDACSLVYGGPTAATFSIAGWEVGEGPAAVTVSSPHPCGTSRVDIRVGATTVGTRDLDRQVGTLTVPLDVAGVGRGTYQVSATVTDAIGRTASSAPIGLVVTGPDPDPGPTDPANFADIPSSGEINAAVEWMWAQGITRGCTETTYCRADPVIRAHMATFIATAKGYPGTTPNMVDLGGVPARHLPNIGALARERVTVGCRLGADHFCPNDSVTRGQMALFLYRALGLQPDPSVTFRDTGSGSELARAVGSLGRAGITQGCSTGPEHFCPNEPVTRGQMALFLYRARHLLD